MGLLCPIFNVLMNRDLRHLTVNNRHRRLENMQSGDHEMQVIDYSVNVGAGKRNVRAFDIQEVRQALEVNFDAVGGRARDVSMSIYLDKGRQGFNPDEDQLLNRKWSLGGGNDRNMAAAIARNGKRVFLVAENHSNRSLRVNVDGRIDDLLGRDTVTLSQDPITAPTPVTSPASPVVPVPSVTMPSSIQIHHSFDPIQVNVSVSGNINHYLTGKIGVDGTIVLDGNLGALPCGC